MHTKLSFASLLLLSWNMLYVTLECRKALRNNYSRVFLVGWVNQISNSSSSHIQRKKIIKKRPSVLIIEKLKKKMFASLE